MPSKLSVLLLILTTPLFVSCVGSRAPLVFQSACSELVPESWLKDGAIESASLPTPFELSADPASAWRLFGVRQTGQLDKANERAPAAVGIISRCEARDKAAIEKLTRPFWAFWR